MPNTLPDGWYHEEVDLTAVSLGELLSEIDSRMPRDSHFSGYENLCALWDEYKQRTDQYREALEQIVDPLTSDVEGYEIARKALGHDD